MTRNRIVSFRRRFIVTAVILCINIILQSTLFQYIKIRGVTPNTMVTIIVSYALLRGGTEGTIIGVAAGLLYDIMYGQAIGYTALLGLCIGYVCGKSFHSFYRENYVLPLLFSAVATFFFETAMYIYGFFFAGDMRYAYYVIAVILPRTVYTAAFSVFAYRILFGINEWVEYKEKNGRYRY